MVKNEDGKTRDCLIDLLHEFVSEGRLAEAKQIAERIRKSDGKNRRRKTISAA